jgi:hypothetical protein
MWPNLEFNVKFNHKRFAKRFEVFLKLNTLVAGGSLYLPLHSRSYLVHVRPRQTLVARDINITSIFSYRQRTCTTGFIL